MVKKATFPAIYVELLYKNKKCSIIYHYLQASIKVTKLFIDFHVTLPSLRLGHRELSLPPVPSLKPLVVAIHLSVTDVVQGFTVLRYWRWQGSAIHFHAHLQQTESSRGATPVKAPRTPVKILWKCWSLNSHGGRENEMPIKLRRETSSSLFLPNTHRLRHWWTQHSLVLSFPLLLFYSHTHSQPPLLSHSLSILGQDTEIKSPPWPKSVQTEVTVSQWCTQTHVLVLIFNNFLHWFIMRQAHTVKFLFLHLAAGALLKKQGAEGKQVSQWKKLKQQQSKRITTYFITCLASLRKSFLGHKPDDFNQDCNSDLGRNTK